jgi:hypothetical protein
MRNLMQRRVKRIAAGSRGIDELRMGIQHSHHPRPIIGFRSICQLMPVPGFAFIKRSRAVDAVPDDVQVWDPSHFYRNYT